VNPIVLAPRALPAPLTGAPATWSRDWAIVGGVTGYLAPAGAMFGATAHPWLVACTATFVLGGAILGQIVPRLLERSRGRVPLTVVGVVLPPTLVLLGMLWAGLAAAWVGAPVGPAAIFGAVAAGFQVGVFWLPYTVAAVLDRPRWPVVIAACMVAPLLGFVARVIFAWLYVTFTGTLLVV
jgi:hypothetical protein